MIANKNFIASDVENSIDPQVYRDTLKQVARESIILTEFGLNAVSNVHQDMVAKVEFSECEIFPFHHTSIDCQEVQADSFWRQPSSAQFEHLVLPLITIKKLLINAFAINEQGRRPYASAGALYPIEPLVFLFDENIEEPIVSGCYHFRAVSKQLQKIKSLSKDFFYDELLHQVIAKSESPSVIILYVAHINKAIFKYRYRGYRHALMEVGSMYQQATLCAQQQNLDTTVWSTFGDYEVLQAINLDPSVFMPVTMQLFGRRKHDISAT